MKRTMNSSAIRPSRRNFIQGVTGLTFAFALDPIVGGPTARATTAKVAPNFWITIGADNVISIVSPIAEMGQGTFTTLPLIVAEELDADWSKVAIVQPPVWDAKKYGNPEYTGALITSASYAVKGYFKTLRIAGAQAIYDDQLAAVRKDSERRGSTIFRCYNRLPAPQNLAGAVFASRPGRH